MTEKSELPLDPGLLDQLADVADRIVNIRRSNKGVLPKELWFEVLKISGSYLCTELLLVTPDGKPVLKVRNDPTATGGEIEWEGKLHIPGISVGTAVRGDSMVKDLLEKEVVNEGEYNLAEHLSKEAVFFGFVRYDEPQRETIADTLIMTLVIDPKDDRFQRDLVILTEKLRENVILEHRLVIEEYYKNPKGGVFLDTRPQGK